MRRLIEILRHGSPPNRDPRRTTIFGAIAVLLLVSPTRDLILAGGRIGTILGVDYRLYIDATSRWLAGGSFYPAYELAAPFATDHDVLYPPNAILLFAPFTVLPAVLWWAIPLGIVAWVIVRLRPDPVAWPFLAICLAWPATALTIVVGNPVLWAVAALALALRHGWPAALIWLKPSLFPFALLGVWHRSWWLALGLLVAMSVPFGGLWEDWFRVVWNSRVGGVFHSIQQVPLLLLPLIAWLGRTRRPAEAPAALEIAYTPIS